MKLEEITTLIPLKVEVFKDALVEAPEACSKYAA